MTRLTIAVRKGIDAAPNVSALARKVGVSQSLLAQIQAGKRQATPAVARQVAKALIAWGARAMRAAGRIREAIPRK
jgi:predicted transcriptional regulator